MLSEWLLFVQLPLSSILQISALNNLCIRVYARMKVHSQAEIQKASDHGRRYIPLFLSDDHNKFASKNMKYRILPYVHSLFSILIIYVWRRVRLKKFLYYSVIRRVIRIKKWIKFESFKDIYREAEYYENTNERFKG